MDKKIKINMYVKGLEFKGQGVGSAAIEQIELVKSIPEFEVNVNGKHKNKYDIRHIHTVNVPHLFKMNKKAIDVCYVHFIPEYDDGSLKMPKGIFKIYRNYVIKFYKKADEVVVVNPYFKKDLLAIGLKEDKITYIPNYVSNERFFKIDDDKRKAVRKSYGFLDNDFVVLGVGQTQTRKGIIDFAKIAEKNPDLKFVWAGGFTFKKITAGYEEIKKIMDNPPSNLKFLGIIDRKDMNDLYNACDVLFLPSYQELMPMTLLECVNCGVPFLVRNLDLYKDIFLSNYLTGEDNEDFEKSLHQLKDDRDFYNKIVGYSNEIANFYSKENVKKLWLDYYKRVYEKYHK